MKRMLYLLPFFCFTVSLISQNGLVAEYYDGTNFDRKVTTRMAKEIDQYWDNVPPVPGINPHECSIRWTGRLQAPETGTYTFSARVDDGIRVWVGNKKVIEDWGLNDVGVFSGEIKMEAGKMYDLKVEYFNALIEGEITLLWSIPNKNESWFEDWFTAEPEVIESKYYFLPKDAVAVNFEEEENPDKKTNVLPPTTKPAPKTKTATPNKTTPKPIAPKEEVATVEVIKKYIPENIQFERAKADILPESFPELNELADFLLRQPHLKVIVEGHTDYVGDAYKNVILSQGRADAVAAYLTGKGIDEKRITAKGYGGARPLAKNDGRKYHPENRRVAFIIE